jgi:hypothetical protein
MSLGHLSFDLSCRLSGLGLLRGLPLLKFESDLVCAPCRHGKMIIASHSPVNSVMTERPGYLLHMDIVDPSWVYFWIFFLESKDEVLEHFWILALRLKNEHPNCLKTIHSDKLSSGTPLLMSFALSMVLISSFLPCVFLTKMESWNERTVLHLRWLG